MNEKYSRRALVALLACLVTLAGCASVPESPGKYARALAPRGALRAAINMGNPILAESDPKSGRPVGVSIDLATNLAERLGVPLELVVYPSAGQVVAAAGRDEWDIAFVARDPVRAQTLLQTTPYLEIEGSYLVPEGSPIQTNDQVDRPGVRIVVGAQSAYDLFLARSLREAKLVRAPTSPAVTETLLREHLEVAAGVRQQLQADAARTPGVRLLPGHFMQIDQAMATTTGHSFGLAYLDAYVSEMKSSGFVARSLLAHHVDGALVAP